MDDSFQTEPAWDGTRVHLEQVGSALAVCDEAGRVLGITPVARRLLQSVGVDARELPVALPSNLWRDLCASPLGHAIEWRPPGSGAFAFLGFTRYRLGGTHFVLLMREISQKQLELSRRLHQQRLEAIGRLVALIAHDLRAPLASIVFNVDVLSSRRERLTPDVIDGVLDGLRAGSERLRWAVDGLLDFARLGPLLAVDVDLGECLARVSGLVRPLLRDRSHRLTCKVDEGARWVRANSLVVEQVLVNLVMNAAESSERAEQIELEAAPDGARAELIRVRVRDTGPGVPLVLRDRVFEPFFTTKPKGTGIGLTTAREAARDLGGDLVLEDSDGGACFAFLLPRAKQTLAPALEGT